MAHKEGLVWRRSACGVVVVRLSSLGRQEQGVAFGWKESLSIGEEKEHRLMEFKRFLLRFRRFLEDL